MDKLLYYFTQSGFPEQAASDIASSFVHKKISRGGFFVEEGKTSKHLGFIENGFLQYFVIVEGEEKTTYASGANSFVASLMSFLKQVPAQESIRAVVETDIWTLEKKKLAQLLDEVTGFKDFYIALLEWQICCIDEARFDAIMLNAQQRYEKMLEKEPELLQQIPLQYLASILGVTPRHLSRIRNNIR